MSLNQLKTPADPTFECTEGRAINARRTAKPTLATVKQKLKQRPLQWCTAKATPVSSFICAVTSVAESSNKVSAVGPGLNTLLFI